MKTINIATVCTYDYINYSLAMFRSFCESYGDEETQFKMHCLVVDLDDTTHPGNMKVDIGIKCDIRFYRTSDLFNSQIGLVNQIIVAKYSQLKRGIAKLPSIIHKSDYLRWSLKAGFVDFLLDNHQMVIYCDNDLMFFESPKDLLDELEQYTMSLSPHWRTIDISQSEEYLFNYKDGLYNGGFFVATQPAKPIMQWWAKMCSVNCSADQNSLVYVDQQYLDVVPIYFDNVHIIRNKGVNVAAWNLTYLPRKIEGDHVTVGGDKIIFVHFSTVTVDWIERGLDHLLSEHLSKFKQYLSEASLQLARVGHSEIDSNMII